MFTINNPGTDDLRDVDTMKCQYKVFQLERGEKEGTDHYQGYVVFESNKRMSAVAKMLKRAHLEPRLGTHEQARAYCMKVESRISGPFETGKYVPGPGQGTRSDLSSIKKMIERGAWCT